MELFLGLFLGVAWFRALVINDKGFSWGKMKLYLIYTYVLKLLAVEYLHEIIVYRIETHGEETKTL